ncbi:anthranilate synthase component I family protein [Candidatus Halobeggiatoa sp. HSG11]|nr:anthranilate synthase component I family protein [Candidatus Halobeggiatoa sp. HSG11]
MTVPSLNTDWINNRLTEHILGHDIDFYKLFAALKTNLTNCYFLESLSLPRHQDRYYAIGFEPDIIFAAKGNNMSLSGEADIIATTTGVKNQTKVTYELDNPYEFLRKQFDFNATCDPHQGGLIGYVCHEAVNYFEPSLNLTEHDDFSTFKFGLYTDGLLYDTTTGTLTYYYFHKDRSEQVKSILADLDNYEIPTELESVKFTGHSVSKEEFIKSVERTKEKIRQGYSFQAEVGFKSHYEIKGDKLAIYNKLRQINPSPYMFYVKFGQEELLGASPEILISCKQNMILTTPTAGTTVRGKTYDEDVQLARKLLSDPKEIAEHNMLVDLHRNDISRVCQPGTVKISDLMYIIKFSHVQHIVSDVVGFLDNSKNAFDVLATILPGGVVTGAPKIETIKIIDENENMPRGPYGGAVGRFSMSGDCDFCLPIRSIFCYGDKCYAQTSAGVVYDSVPEKEYAEVTHKLAAMKQALEELGGI